MYILQYVLHRVGHCNIYTVIYIYVYIYYTLSLWKYNRSPNHTHEAFWFPFYWHGLTEAIALISHRTHWLKSGVITHPLPNLLSSLTKPPLKLGYVLYKRLNSLNQLLSPSKYRIMCWRCNIPEIPDENYQGGHLGFQKKWMQIWCSIIKHANRAGWLWMFYSKLSATHKYIDEAHAFSPACYN